MFDDIQNEFDKSVRKMAESNLLKKLNAQGINRTDITNEKFAELLEMEILKSDGKKVGTGIGVGIALTLLTGGLF